MAEGDRARRVRTPLFPLYSEVRALLPVWDGVPKEEVWKLIKEIWEHTGTPQNPVDWSDPDKWIGERLRGQHQELARAIWQRTRKTVNPRHVYGSYLFIYGYDLLAPDPSRHYHLTERGECFLREDTAVVREIDEFEGIPELLAILATKTRAKRADLLPEWGEFLRAFSRYGTDSTIKDTLRRRLINIVERGFATREGNTFAITAKGTAYAATAWRAASEPHQEVLRAINAYNTEQIDLLRERLGEISPQRFERLVGDLLEAMGYEDVAVVGQAGDRGIDVVGTVQVGITTIREVVQVKRHKSNINRKVVDQLRGALPYHQAIRGTLITLGRFTSGCAEAALYPGAAPITLIDGDRLIELLIEHEIAVTRREAYLTDIDEDYFTPLEEAALDETVEDAND
jgi:restriction system protein